MNIPSASMRSNQMRGWIRWLACLLMSVPAVSFAHGLLLDAKHVHDRIEGTVYYSNGELAVRESVELLDLTTPITTAAVAETDDAGKFSFPVTSGHRYRVSAYAAEGHGVDVEIEAVANARPQLIENEAATAEQSWLPPAWAVIGLLLLASMVPIALSRRRPTAT
ncbi:carboxypeptidase-like regulatory domain-containing protein [Steroidobacter sp.]|uniref:carboxypeptidase-like regulatory domain-containing protein n=1 Tax=Steroidobacter sp. TaxID=1978227 RepID=UPI001A5A2C0F|nr:carboxypeptidase-like regulatory domain-containing protein [Steroidobacter sp.]MBL8270852.1 carboxypeptidase regulatory-like domain-containing protein [Steroidobacter sp.]